ncbi:hypothetical protein KP509_01G112900 [Ceratopteris richardii]|uniref:Sulfotransferase n=1 Tax=Ceratopteris richardii TaxID=49495 RepID=A0A8T2VT59_CERRI|nr:hypothetical protein KP509_01G112900 [Ceratopteris richardii]
MLRLDLITEGRSVAQYLLRNLYPKEQHCDRSYDKLRFNSSNHCRLLVTHDDYSILSKLPVKSTSVVTNLRDPVDRVFSAYEFSVEVAARFLIHNLRRNPKTTKSGKNGSSTLNIWPWSLLVPWMRDDLFERERRRLSEEAEILPLGFSNYDASPFVMPLHEFIRQPMVMDIIHNGATFQVAGLTNNSYTKAAAKIRKCTIDHPNLGHHVLEVAKKRLDKMIFVGLTEKHGDSAKLFAHLIGRQILPLGQPISDTLSNEVISSADLSVPNAGISEPPNLQAPDSGSIAQSAKENLTVYGLIDKYQKCAGRLRRTQVQRRIASLKHSLPVNFSNEARQEVPEEILDEIREMNFLDLALYEHAQRRFKSQLLIYDSLQHELSKQHEHTSKIWDTEIDMDAGYMGIDESLQMGFGSTNWKFVSVLCMAVAVVTMMASFVVFIHGNRVFKLRKWQARNVVHEKF